MCFGEAVLIFFLVIREQTNGNEVWVELACGESAATESCTVSNHCELILKKLKERKR